MSPAAALPDPADAEAHRLAALHALDILDTGPEAIFDHLTHVAALIFQAPTALISLIDAERQWFKSCVGLDATETPRDAAFCDYTIRQDAVMVVPDALLHPVFKDYTLVTGPPFIRFYAGAPLIAADGARLGSLCVIDYVPRSPITPEETEKLQALAAAVSAAMVARRDVAAYVALEHRLREADAELRASQASLSFLTQHSADLILRLDPASVITWASPSASHYGYAPADLIGQSAASLIHPDDRPKLAARRADRFADLADPIPGEAAREFRVRARDGAWVWVEENPTVVRDADGRAVELVNVLRDITDRKRAERAAADIQAGMLQSRDALACLTPHAQIDAVLAPARTVGGDLYDVFTLPDGPTGHPRLGFLLGDVTGKGVAASLFMALSKALAHSLLAAQPDDLPAAFAALQAELARSNREAMALSLLAGVIDLTTGALRLCNAGMEDPVILHPDGRAEPLPLDGGPPLCAAPDFRYRTELRTLPPGATLIAMTDGVTEAQDPAGQPFGRAGALAALAAAPTGAGLAEVVDGLVAAVRAAEAGGDPTDDLAVLAVRWA